VVHIVDHKNNYERMTAVRKSINMNEVRHTNFTVEMTVEVPWVSRYCRYHTMLYNIENNRILFHDS